MPNKPKISETSPEILMFGYLCIKGESILREQVGILDRFGLATSDIATICGCNDQAVWDARHDVKTSKTKGTKLRPRRVARKRK